MDETLIHASFSINGSDIQGVLDTRASGNQSRVFTLYSSQPILVQDASHVYGKCLNHKSLQVSLIDCLGNQRRFLNPQGSTHELTLYSHLMIIGPEHICPQTRMFDAITVTLGNPEHAITRNPAFGNISNITAELKNALNTELKQEKFQSEHRQEVLSYYTGEQSLLKCSTSIGEVKIWNSFSYGGGPGFNVKGAGIRNNIKVTIRFPSPQTLSEAFESASQLHIALKVISGRGLYFHEITLEKNQSPEKPPLWFDVCHHNYIDFNNYSENTSFDTPIVDITDESFVHGLSNWLERSDRNSSRRIMRSIHFESKYDPKRLILAASAFETLPGNDKPFTHLGPETQTFIENLRFEIRNNKEILDNKVYQQLLGTIGRVGSPSLQDIIFSRIEVLKTHLKSNDIKHQDFERAVKYSVQLRNYYVHGHQRKPEKIGVLQAHLAFLIDTLEYTFLICELLDAGISLNTQKIFTTNHKLRIFERYFYEYFNSLESALKTAV